STSRGTRCRSWARTGSTPTSRSITARACCRRTPSISSSASRRSTSKSSPSISASFNSGQNRRERSGGGTGSVRVGVGCAHGSRARREEGVRRRVVVGDWAGGSRGLVGGRRARRHQRAQRRQAREDARGARGGVWAAGACGRRGCGAFGCGGGGGARGGDAARRARCAVHELGRAAGGAVRVARGDGVAARGRPVAVVDGAHGQRGAAVAVEVVAA